MTKLLKKALLVLILILFLVSCGTAETIQPSPTEENQSPPTIFLVLTASPTIAVTSPPIATPFPTTPAQATIEAFGSLCIGSKDLHGIELSPNGKWIAATCYDENGKDESPLQVSSIDHSHDWKIYYSDYIFSPDLGKRGLSLDPDDGVVPYHWSKDGRFLYATVGSRLDGCCWISGGRYVLLVRLNLETGEQIAILNSAYYSDSIFNFIISDSDRYLLFTPPSYQQPYDFAILDFQTWETQEIFLKVKRNVHMAYAKLSPKEDKVLLPLFKFNPDDKYYVDSIGVVDLITGRQDILITGLTPEKQLFPIRWTDDSHVLISNINPVYYAGNQTESHWLLDINSGQLEEATPQHEKPPNTACTRRVGVAAFSSSFLAWSRFRQNGVLSSRPPAGNASRWAARRKNI